MVSQESRRRRSAEAQTALEGVDKINNEVVACYLDVGGACHGNDISTRRHCAVKQRRRQTTSVEA